MCSVYIWDAGAERKSSAIAYKLETGILIFVTQSIFHGCTCDRSSMQTWQTFLRPTDSWVGTWEEGTADRRLATCLRDSVANDTVAVHPLQSNNHSGLETFSFCFVFSRFRFFLFRVFFRFIFIWADFYVSICINGFITILLTHILVSVSINENHTATRKW